MTPFRLDPQPFVAAGLVRSAQGQIPRLRSLGVGTDTVLAVQSDDPACWSWIWALARAAGQPFMPLAPYLDAAQTAALLAMAGGAALLDCDSAGLQLLQPARPGAHPLQLPIRLIVHSSGSEGEPRGVMHSDAGVAAASNAACRRLDFSADDLWLGCLAPWHIGGIAIVERALHSGASVLLQPGFEAGEVWWALQDHPVSHLSLVPAMLAALLEEAAVQAPPPSLRRVLIGGAALDPGLQRRAVERGWPLCVSYGLSEAGSQAATRCDPGLEWSPGDVGRPIDGMELKLESQAGTEGRILLRGPMLMAGYLNPLLVPGNGLTADGWFRTGDLGRLDDRGNLQVLGRCDDVIISGGVNVHPAPLERLLHGHPAVREAVVVGTPDTCYGEIVTAVVSGSIDTEQLLAWCRERLASPQRPRRVIVLERLPRLPGGKLDRRRLKQLAAEGSGC